MSPRAKKNYGHHLQRIDGVYRCTLCCWEWTCKPRHYCPRVPRYTWRDLPEHLKTQTMLRKLRLHPGNRDRGVVFGQLAGWVPLYDVREAVPMRPLTVRMIAAAARRREANEAHRDAQEASEMAAEWAETEAEHQAWLAECHEVAIWATAALAGADTVFFDLETTGLDGNAEIVQVGVVTGAGLVLVDTLVKPLGAIPAESTAIHGITDSMVAAAPTFAEVYPQIAAALTGKTVIAYNVGYDRSILRAATRRHNLPMPRAARWDCAMEQYATWVGDWSDYFGGYKYQPLPGAGHNAVEDCQAVRTLLATISVAQENGVPHEPLRGPQLPQLSFPFLVGV